MYLFLESKFKISFKFKFSFKFKSQRSQLGVLRAANFRSPLQTFLGRAGVYVRSRDNVCPVIMIGVTSMPVRAGGNFVRPTTERVFVSWTLGVSLALIRPCQNRNSLFPPHPGRNSVNSPLLPVCRVPRLQLQAVRGALGLEEVGNTVTWAAPPVLDGGTGKPAFNGCNLQVAQDLPHSPS